MVTSRFSLCRAEDNREGNHTGDPDLRGRFFALLPRKTGEYAYAQLDNRSPHTTLHNRGMRAWHVLEYLDVKT